MIGMVKGTTRQIKQVAGLPAPIASFQSNVSGVKLDSLKVLVTAQQDLHGYDKPWAGGAGANLWGGDGMLQDFINANISDFSYDTTEKTLTYGAPQIANKTIKIFANAKENTAYTLILSAKNTANTTHTNLMVYYTDGTYAPMTAPTSLSTKQTFAYVTNASKTLESVRGGNYNGRATIYYDECCVLEGVKTVSDFVPWENICPITGWSGANITRTGKNLADGTAFAQALVANGASIDTVNKTVTYSGSQARNTGKVFDKFKPNTVYTFMARVTADSSVANINASIVYTDGTSTNLADMTKGQQWAWTSNPNKSVDYFQFSWITGSPTVYYEDFGIFEGKLTASDFEPYNGNTYTIAFGDTYYGGELDVTNGVLRVTHELVDMGTANWVGSYYQFTIPTPSTAKGFNGDNLCSIYPRSAVNNTTPSVQTDKSYIVRSDTIYVKDTDYNGNLAGFKTAMAGQKLVYELATPIEIQLTPQQIAQLLGDNNVFADCGDVEEVKYLNRIDTVLFSKG